MVWHQVNTVFFHLNHPHLSISCSMLFHAEESTPVLKKYQSSVWLLHTHLLHLQRWRLNTPFVWVDTVAAFSLSPSPSHSLCFLLCYLLFPNKADWRKLWCKGTNSPSYCYVCVWKEVINTLECTFPYVRCKKVYIYVCVCVCEICTMYTVCASFMIQRSSVRLGRMNQVAEQLNVWQ